jgi:hypothetical protein
LRSSAIRSPAIRDIPIASNPSACLRASFRQYLQRTGHLGSAHCDARRPLAILELKAAEDIHLPLQAANYTSMLMEFSSRGYYDRLASYPASSAAGRFSSLRIFHWNRVATRRADCLFGCVVTAFSSHYRRIATPSFAGDRSGPRGPCGKLAPRTSRRHAAAARNRASCGQTSSGSTGILTSPPRSRN